MYRIFMSVGGGWRIFTTSRGLGFPSMVRWCDSLAEEYSKSNFLLTNADGLELYRTQRVRKDDFKFDWMKLGF